MGKKPVLGLVGLCVGLALSGCKSGGTKTSRSDSGPTTNAQKDATARSSKQSQRSVYDGRKSVAEDRTAGKGSTPAQPAKQYDYGDDWKVPTPADQMTEKPVTRVSMPQEKYDAAGVYAGKGPQEGVEQTSAAPGKKQGTKNTDFVNVPPPPPPPQTDTRTLDNQVAVPVEPGKSEVPTSLEKAKAGVLSEPDMPLKSSPPSSGPSDPPTTGKVRTAPEPMAPLAPETKVAPTAPEPTPPASDPKSPPMSKPEAEKELELGTAPIPPGGK